MFDFASLWQVDRARQALMRGYRPAGSAPRVAIIPPAKPGSLGDAAMISATASYWRQQGAEFVDLIYGGEWQLDAEIRRRLASDHFFYGGKKLQHIKLLRQLRDYSHVVMIGADVIDGAYNPPSVCRRLSLVHDFATAGGYGRVLGASYNEHPEQTTRQALANLPKTALVCARDPVSFTRLEKVCSATPRQVADLAFLLAPRDEHPDAKQAKEWIAKQKADGRFVVGLNINYLQVQKEPGLTEAFKIITRVLIERGCSLLLVPHDTRTATPDAHHLRSATVDLAPDSRSRTYMIESVSPGAIKSALAQIDLLVTGRLHAQILAMGAGTPVMGLAYQGKFEGVYQLFKLDSGELLFEPGKVAKDPVSLAEAVMKTLQNTGLLRDQIRQRLPAVLDLSTQNFT